ncbi:hypothetical protein AYI70_g4827 [Smittium culicis]|uniref:Uncharacterized protein n=1 Tax=Smittium culicis TaxID=133412 RepID=A0A1R1XX91_9FUNG|nr:hypothetical protein AYI70_g4827 [Smittium culicis]
MNGYDHSCGGGVSGYNGNYSGNDNNGYYGVGNGSGNDTETGVAYGTSNNNLYSAISTSNMNYENSIPNKNTDYLSSYNEEYNYNGSSNVNNNYNYSGSSAERTTYYNQSYSNEPSVQDRQNKQICNTFDQVNSTNSKKYSSHKDFDVGNQVFDVLNVNGLYVPRDDVDLEINKCLVQQAQNRSDNNYSPTSVKKITNSNNNGNTNFDSYNGDNSSIIRGNSNSSSDGPTLGAIVSIKNANINNESSLSGKKEMNGTTKAFDILNI